MGVLPLEHAQLLPEQQDLNILGIINSTVQASELKEQREHVRENEEEHVCRPCRDHADETRGRTRYPWGPLAGLERLRLIFRTLRPHADVRWRTPATGGDAHRHHRAA